MAYSPPVPGWLMVGIQLMLIKFRTLKVISDVDILILYHNFGATCFISPIQEPYFGFLLYARYCAKH